jgi:DNA polymerase-3 subunit delta'
VTIVLCADQEARLLPTVRSRCFRVRLGLVGARDIEAIVADHDLADPPTAARLGRLAGGRPGLALAYARTPAAVLIRAELTRVALDLTEARPSARLAAARTAVPRAIALSAALASAEGAPVAARVTRRRGGTAATPVVAGSDTPSDDDAGDATAEDEATPARTPASERRRGVEVLVGLWADVARDLVLVGAGGARSVHDTVLLEELTAISSAIPPGSAAAFLARTARAAELLASNVSPELLLDALVLAWPRRAAVA